jgi:hypothetical protein
MLHYLLQLLLVHLPASLTCGEQCGLHKSWQNCQTSKCTVRGCTLCQPFHINLLSVIVHYHHCCRCDQLKTILCRTIFESKLICQIPGFCCELHCRQDIRLHMCSILQQSAIWHVTCLFNELHSVMALQSLIIPKAKGLVWLIQSAWRYTTSMVLRNIVCFKEAAHYLHEKHDILMFTPTFLSRCVRQRHS